MTEHLSAPGSSMIASFIGASSTFVINMHRFKTNTPVEWMSKWGWNGTKEDLCDIMPRYGKEHKDSEGPAGNMLNVPRGGVWMCCLHL